MNNIILMPEYMKDFHCTSLDCKDDCCYGWKVTIDKDTYKKCRKVQKTALRNELSRHILIDKHRKTFNDYAYISIEKDKSCPFQCEEKLCKIHRDLGEEYLSLTCKNYPRLYAKVDSIFEASLDMSCPEVAKLVLFNKESLAFEEVETNKDLNNSLGIVIDTKSIPIYNYFWDIRVGVITILQNRKLSIEQRLILVGLMINKIEESKKNGKLESITGHIDYYVNKIDSDELRELIESLPNNLGIQMKILEQIIAFCSNGTLRKNYVDSIEKFKKGLKIEDEIQMEECIKAYKEATKEYYEPYIKDREYIFENYLVNDVFQRMFPYKDENFFNEYMILVLNYSIIRLLLTGMASCDKELTDTMVIDLIYSFSRDVLHNNVFIKSFIDALNESKFNTLSHMIVLIKN
ncbi:flagellin lysine-N-methylase [Clostridium sp. FP2]|uniref:flagellin lysine-N-methylase n=1 Tax=Clostridium sp. FP2 TaxID=2724481 RepID=UPI0013E92BB4|nr:flagellin lysine-N-methylase [Clostridium sp. FP2]MBZ9624554.1 flagellin lysine-N-methylase [Clostridium sp. FP2]